MDIRKSFSLISLAGVISISAALGASKPSAKQVEEAKTTTEVNDVRIRREVASSGFDEFKKNTYREPFENGVYIVNGDTPIADDEELRDFYEMELLAAWKNSAFGLELNDALPALIADAPQGKVIAWDDVTKRNITYCVSTSFGGRYNIVVAAMAEAAKAWEDVSDVKFNHVAKLDQSCDENTAAVVFDVRPVNVNEQYLARAFFPRYARSKRNVLIDESALTLGPGKLTLVGILRHELGHALSYRHEQTRPEAGKCFEDSNWKPLSDYDAFSVMHYPQCNGLGDWSLNLTESDKRGAACLYGPSPNSSFGQLRCPAR